jgi:IS605 OrfB family transposase
LSSKLVRDNQTICVEDLAVKNMMKNHKLAKSISDVGWSQFIGFLTYKADWYGKNILTIGRFEPSSKMCSCGKINQNLKLSDRIWSCPCGQTHDRDTLAANNIKKFGLITYDKKFGESQNIGREPSEFKPLENLASVGNRKVSFKSKSKKEEKQVEILSTKPTRSLAGR